jgi:hypothetical protein
VTLVTPTETSPEPKRLVLFTVLIFVPLTRAACFPLNVDQSVVFKTPRLDADAVGTFNVITGVVVPLATVEDKSVPVVPNVSAATDVTLPAPAEPLDAEVIRP